MILGDFGASIAESMEELATPAMLTRGTMSWPCSVIVEEQDRSANNMLAIDERLVNIFGLTIAPRPRDAITIGDRTLTIQSVAYAAMGAAYRCVAKG